MKQKKLFYLFCVFLLVTYTIQSQDSNVNSHTLEIKIPKVALISVQSLNSSITLKGNKITEAGKKIKFKEVDNSTWINYSSIVGSTNEPNRYVTIEISEGVIPDGLNLMVKAENDAGFGDGSIGKPVNSSQILENTPIKIIENIGSCYTGVGVNKGHNIIYNLELSNKENAYGKLNFDQSQTIAITYTLSEN